MPEGIQTKSILNKTKRVDPWFLDSYTANPYSGCTFNCLFCYIRGSKYGTHMGPKALYKENAVELLEKELGRRAKKREYGFIVLSSSTDPYLHFEKDLELTKQMLQVILKYKFPVHIITRSDLVERDFELLKEIGDNAVIPEMFQGKLNKGIIITFSFSTVEDDIAAIFEPGATPPSVRLATMKAASAAGFLTGVSFMPVIPFISDSYEQLDHAFQLFKENDAHYVMPAGLQLWGSDQNPHDAKAQMYRAIQKHYPHLKEKFQQLYSAGSSFFHSYENMLDKVCKEFKEKYQMPDRIIYHGDTEVTEAHGDD